MSIEEKIEKYIGEKIKVDKFTGTTKDGKKVVLQQNKNGMFEGEIRDESGNIESSTIEKTAQEVKKWFEEQGIKDIKWDKK